MRAQGPEPFAAAASSHHPVTAYATGEVIGAVLEAVGPGPALAVVAATPGHAGAIEDVARAVRETLAPMVLLGAVSATVATGAAPSGSGPTVALWTARCSPVGALRIAPDGSWTAGLARWTHALVLAVRPPDPDTLGRFRPLIGGVTGGPLVVDDEVVHDGAVGAVLAGVVSSVVARGLRPFGPPQRVDATAGRVIETLAGRRPLDRLVEAARDGVPAPALRHLGRGLHLSLVALPAGADPDGPGGPVAVVGTERASGALVLASEVPVGAVVRFAIPDVDAVAGELDAAGAGASRAALAFGPHCQAAALWPPEREAVLPAATLWCEAPLQLGAADEAAPTHEDTTTAALFPDPWGGVEGGG